MATTSLAPHGLGADASGHSCFIGRAGGGVGRERVKGPLHNPSTSARFATMLRSACVAESRSPRIQRAAPRTDPESSTNESALPHRAPTIAELCTFTIVSAAFRARRFSCTCPLLCDFLEQGLWRLSRRLSRSLRKPAVCGGQHRACFSALVLLREQSAPRLIVARNSHDLAPGSRAIDMTSRRASSISIALRRQRLAVEKPRRTGGTSFVSRSVVAEIGHDNVRFCQCKLN